MPDPWNQLTTETKQSYDAFSIFRDMGPSRTLTGAYRLATGRPKVFAPGRWRDWSNKHNWNERALAFDANIERIRMEDPARRQKDLAADYASAQLQNEQLAMENEIVRRLYGRFVEMVSHPITRTRTETHSADGKTIHVQITEPSGWNERTIINLARVLTQVGRLLRKLPATVVEQESTPHDFKALLFENDFQIADALPGAAAPPIPDDVLAKPAIADAAKRGSDPAAGLSQPGIVRPPR